MIFSIYLSGKIPKGEEINSFRDWRKEFKREMERENRRYPNIKKIVYLDPNSFSTDGIPVLDYFGRDVQLIHMCDAVLVDARRKLGAGAAQEIIVAKYYGKPVVTVIPKDSHYQRKTVVRGQEFDYKHPFLFSTSDAVVDNLSEAAAWLLKFFSGETNPVVKGMEIFDKAKNDYIINHLGKDDFIRKWKKEMWE